MLTPQQIKDYEFKLSGRNTYKADDVDAFFAELTIDYEKMFRENAELIKRVNLLADKLEQYKNDEDKIKNAVITAQKAADLIVKDAENSVADSKEEAEAVLNAAKSEAELIKSDAEKQAVADSELLLSMTRDKAQDIIRKAKEEAEGIIIDAKSSAQDKVGAATRTITSESLHFDMLKKEVSDFKSSILAQYKEHIELLSKLPEIAAEKAKETVIEKIAEDDVVDYIPSLAEEETSDVVGEETVETTKVINSSFAIKNLSFDDDFIYGETETDENGEDVATDEVSDVAQTEEQISAENFDNSTEFDVDVADSEEEEFDSEPVIKTTLPYDFFNDEGALEFVDENDDKSKENVDKQEENINSDFSLECDFDFKFDDLSEESFNKTENKETVLEEQENENTAESVLFDAGFSDIPISKGFSIDKEAIETLEDDESSEKPDKEKRHGFFKHKKK